MIKTAILVDGAFYRKRAFHLFEHIDGMRTYVPKEDNT